MNINGSSLDVLKKNGEYWMVNWKIVNFFQSFDEAILLAYFSSIQIVFGNQHGWFYRTIPSVQEDTLLDGRRQRKAINNLKRFGLIEMETVGMPKKRYFRVKPDGIEVFLNKLRMSEQNCIN